MKRTFYLCSIVLCGLFSCTLEKTDYEAEIDTPEPSVHEFREATRINSGPYLISIEALNGTFYQGFNEVRVRILDEETKLPVDVAEVTCVPIYTNAQQEHASGPHGYEMQKSAPEKYFHSYVVFPTISNSDSRWELYLNFRIGGHIHRINPTVTVHEQPNKNLNMVQFEGKDGAEYFIALIAPKTPKVGENALVAGVFRFEQPTQPPQSPFPDPLQYKYVPLQGHRLVLDPRMPDPSMGNHSSPNNQDLTPRADGFYEGVVNYTMTGNWTLNFILLDAQGQRIKGSDVPTDFTPGVPGVKSELFIDILF